MPRAAVGEQIRMRREHCVEKFEVALHTTQMRTDESHPREIAQHSLKLPAFCRHGRFDMNNHRQPPGVGQRVGGIHRTAVDGAELLAERQQSVVELEPVDPLICQARRLAWTVDIAGRIRIEDAKPTRILPLHRELGHHGLIVTLKSRIGIEGDIRRVEQEHRGDTAAIHHIDERSGPRWREHDVLVDIDDAA